VETFKEMWNLFWDHWQSEDLSTVHMGIVMDRSVIDTIYTIKLKLWVRSSSTATNLDLYWLIVLYSSIYNKRNNFTCILNAQKKAKILTVLGCFEKCHCFQGCTYCSSKKQRLYVQFLMQTCLCNWIMNHYFYVFVAFETFIITYSYLWLVRYGVIALLE